MGYLDLLQNHLFLKCQLLHLTTLQVSFSRVLWTLKFLLSPSRSLQRKSYNCNTLLRKRDWITTKQNSLSHLFKPYQTWMKSHTSTHCGPIFTSAFSSHFLYTKMWWSPSESSLILTSFVSQSWEAFQAYYLKYKIFVNTTWTVFIKMTTHLNLNL